MLNLTSIWLSVAMLPTQMSSFSVAINHYWAIIITDNQLYVSELPLNTVIPAPTVILQPIS